MFFFGKRPDFLRISFRHSSLRSGSTWTSIWLDLPIGLQVFWRSSQNQIQNQRVLRMPWVGRLDAGSQCAGCTKPPGCLHPRLNCSYRFFSDQIIILEEISYLMFHEYSLRVTWYLRATLQCTGQHLQFLQCFAHSWGIRSWPWRLGERLFEYIPENAGQRRILNLRN